MRERIRRARRDKRGCFSGNEAQSLIINARQHMRAHVEVLTIETPRPCDLKKRTMIVSWTTERGLIPRPNTNIPSAINRMSSEISPKRRRIVPERMMPVAKILVNVVPSLLAKIPPTSGVHVLFRVKADIRRLNSVLDVPNSRRNRDLRGPRTYKVLENKHELGGEKNDWLEHTNGFRCSESMYTTKLKFALRKLCAGGHRWLQVACQRAGMSELTWWGFK
jgi:hypothetical protein